MADDGPEIVTRKATRPIKCRGIRREEGEVFDAPLSSVRLHDEAGYTVPYEREEPPAEEPEEGAEGAAEEEAVAAEGEGTPEEAEAPEEAAEAAEEGVDEEPEEEPEEEEPTSEEEEEPAPDWDLTMGPEEYLNRYPDGQHAEKARAVLEAAEG